MNDKIKENEPTIYTSTEGEHLEDLTTTTLYVLGMLAAKKDWVPASFLAHTLKKQGVQCDYLQPLIDQAEAAEALDDDTILAEVIDALRALMDAYDIGQRAGGSSAIVKGREVIKKLDNRNS